MPVIRRLASLHLQQLLMHHDFMAIADSRWFLYHRNPEVPRPVEFFAKLPHRPASAASLRIVDRSLGGLPLHHRSSCPFVAEAAAAND